jgi:hypothetical protein
MEGSGQLETLAALSLDWRLDGPQLVWMLWSRDKSVASARNQTLAIQPIAILLSQYSNGLDGSVDIAMGWMAQ